MFLFVPRRSVELSTAAGVQFNNRSWDAGWELEKERVCVCLYVWEKLPTATTDSLLAVDFLPQSHGHPWAPPLPPPPAPQPPRGARLPVTAGLLTSGEYHLRCFLIDVQLTLLMLMRLLLSEVGLFALEEYFG